MNILWSSASSQKMAFSLDNMLLLHIVFLSLFLVEEMNVSADEHLLSDKKTAMSRNTKHEHEGVTSCATQDVIHKQVLIIPKCKWCIWS